MNTITICPIENKEREYFAFYRDEFLQCVFSVSFKDTILGALALQRFVDMIKTFCQEESIIIDLSHKQVRFTSQAVLDTVTGTKEGKQ